MCERMAKFRAAEVYKNVSPLENLLLLENNVSFNSQLLKKNRIILY